jgi:hypothetical protein
MNNNDVKCYNTTTYPNIIYYDCIINKQQMTYIYDIEFNKTTIIYGMETLQNIKQKRSENISIRGVLIPFNESDPIESINRFYKLLLLQ